MCVCPGTCTFVWYFRASAYVSLLNFCALEEQSIAFCFLSLSKEVLSAFFLSQWTAIIVFFLIEFELSSKVYDASPQSSLQVPLVTAYSILKYSLLLTFVIMVSSYLWLCLLYILPCSSHKTLFLQSANIILCLIVSNDIQCSIANIYLN